MSQTFSGKVAEYELAAELIKRGITPCWPSTETEPYDLLCWANGRALRIQVKGSQITKNRIHMNCQFVGHGKRRAYTEKDIDFLAVKIFATGDWFLIPASAVHRKLTFYVYEDKGPLKEYRNAWHLLEA